MKYFAMRGSQDINKSWPLCNNICFKFFSKEIWATDCTAQCYLQESQMHLDVLWVSWKSVFTQSTCVSQKAQPKGIVLEVLGTVYVDSTVLMLSSRWALQHGCSFWRKDNLITALTGPGLPQKQPKLRAPPKAIQTVPMGNRPVPNLTCPCGMERWAPLQKGSG